MSRTCTNCFRHWPKKWALKMNGNAITLKTRVIQSDSSTKSTPFFSLTDWVKKLNLKTRTIPNNPWEDSSLGSFCRNLTNWSMNYLLSVLRKRSGDSWVKESKRIDLSAWVLLSIDTIKCKEMKPRPWFRTLRRSFTLLFNSPSMKFSI